MATNTDKICDGSCSNELRNKLEQRVTAVEIIQQNDIAMRERLEQSLDRVANKLERVADTMRDRSSFEKGAVAVVSILFAVAGVLADRLFLRP